MPKHGLHRQTETRLNFSFMTGTNHRQSLELTTTSVGDGETVKWMDKDGIDGINDRNGA